MLVTHSIWGSCFFSDSAERRLHGLFVLGPLDMALAHVPQGTGQEAAGAAGRIEQRLARFGRSVHHEGGHSAGRVVLARIARRLQVIEDLFVDVAEMLAFAQVVEVDIVILLSTWRINWRISCSCRHPRTRLARRGGGRGVVGHLKSFQGPGTGRR